VDLGSRHQLGHHGIDVRGSSSCAFILGGSHEVIEYEPRAG
jgi:hypothetical protein